MSDLSQLTGAEQAADKNVSFVYQYFLENPAAISFSSP
jgi:hypothetical protein